MDGESTQTQAGAGDQTVPCVQQPQQEATAPQPALSLTVHLQAYIQLSVSVTLDHDLGPVPPQQDMPAGDTHTQAPTVPSASSQPGSSSGQPHLPIHQPNQVVPDVDANESSDVDMEVDFYDLEPSASCFEGVPE